jgi:hypothetical protein
LFACNVATFAGPVTASQLTLSLLAGESRYEEKVRHRPAQGKVLPTRNRGGGA